MPETLICPKHQIPMQIVPERRKLRVRWPLRRCSRCAAEFRAALDKAMAAYKGPGGRSKR